MLEILLAVLVVVSIISWFVQDDHPQFYRDIKDGWRFGIEIFIIVILLTIVAGVGMGFLGVFFGITTAPFLSTGILLLSLGIAFYRYFKRTSKQIEPLGYRYKLGDNWVYGNEDN